MSVATKVQKTIDEMEAGDPIEALYQICSAIDVTARAETGKDGRSGYKQFIHENLGLITNIAFGGTKVLNLHFGYDHPNDHMKRDANGRVSFQELMYHVVRCGLMHDTKIPDTLRFVDKNDIRMSDGELELPKSLIYGLLVSVIVAPSNGDEQCVKEAQLNFDRFPIPVAKLWGRRQELLWLLDVENHARRIRRETATKT